MVAYFAFRLPSIQLFHIVLSDHQVALVTKSSSGKWPWMYLIREIVWQAQSSGNTSFVFCYMMG